LSGTNTILGPKKRPQLNALVGVNEIPENQEIRRAALRPEKGDTLAPLWKQPAPLHLGNVTFVVKSRVKYIYI
jgi:hypothetical protein